MSAPRLGVLDLLTYAAAGIVAGLAVRLARSLEPELAGLEAPNALRDELRARKARAVDAEVIEYRERAR